MIKIHLTTNTPTKSVNVEREIADKLNGLIKNSEFFSCEYGILKCPSCANVQTYNKLVIFLALLIDSNYDEFGCFTRFGFGNSMEFDLGRFADKLKQHLDNIQSINDIQISID